jgi:hypothetical protein
MEEVWRSYGDGNRRICQLPGFKPLQTEAAGGGRERKARSERCSSRNQQNQKVASEKKDQAPTDPH